MNKIYKFLMDNLNYDIMYLIHYKVEIYNTKCKFRYALEQLLNIKEDFNYYDKGYNEEFYFSKFVLDRNRIKSECRK